MAKICSSNSTSGTAWKCIYCYVCLLIELGHYLVVKGLFHFCVATLLYLTFGSVPKVFAYFCSRRLGVRNGSFNFAREVPKIVTTILTIELNAGLSLLCSVLRVTCVHLPR